MKVQVENKFWYNDKPQPTKQSVVTSVYASTKNDILTVVVNTVGRNVEIRWTESSQDSVGFTFGYDHEFCGEYTATVTFTGETPEEIVMLKGNQFRQIDKEQFVFKFLPWDEPNDETELVSWRQEQ